MPTRAAHAPGTFCWPEITTGDVPGSLAFYSGLFGWDIRTTPSGGYWIAHKGEHAVAGLYGLAPAQKAHGVPPHWLPYVRVLSTDAAAVKAAALGGTVVAPPFEVPGIGRMAVVVDPADAAFAVWEPKGHEGVGLVEETGAPCWYELMTRDAGKAGAFYRGLFDWRPDVQRMEPGDGCGEAFDYTTFHAGAALAAGMMEMTGPHWGDIPSHWTTYIAVDDADAAGETCRRLGGKVVAGPRDIPGVGRFCVMTAPDGAVFAVIRPA
jgi:predicted enzyme related to lactoylglutathione lyase